MHITWADNKKTIILIRKIREKNQVVFHENLTYAKGWQIIVLSLCLLNGRLQNCFQVIFSVFYTNNGEAP